MVPHIESLKEQAWKSFLHLVPLSFPCFLLPCLLCVCLLGLSGFTHSAIVLYPSILLKLHCQQNVAFHPCNSSTWEVEAEKLGVHSHLLSQIEFKSDLCYVRHCHKRRRGYPPSACPLALLSWLVPFLWCLYFLSCPPSPPTSSSSLFLCSDIFFLLFPLSYFIFFLLISSSSLFSSTFFCFHFPLRLFSFSIPYPLFLYSLPLLPPLLLYFTFLLLLFLLLLPSSLVQWPSLLFTLSQSFCSTILPKAPDFSSGVLSFRESYGSLWKRSTDSMKFLCKRIISPAHETLSHSFLFPANCLISRTNYSSMADKSPRAFTLS